MNNLTNFITFFFKFDFDYSLSMMHYDDADACDFMKFKNIFF